MDVFCNDQFVHISASKNSIYSFSIVIPFGSTGRSVTIAAVSVAVLTCCYDVKAPSSVGVIAFHQWLMTLYIKQDMTQILKFIQKTIVDNSRQRHKFQTVFLRPWSLELLNSDRTALKTIFSEVLLNV